MTIINYSNIDVNYPVAGQDNDSQGFRTNFTAISSAFAEADSALSNLSTSTAKLNLDNDFLGSSISHAIFKNNVGEYKPDTVTTDPYTVYFNQATFWDLDVTTSTTVQVSSWPSVSNWTSNAYYASVRVQFNPDATAASLGYDVNFQSLVAGGVIHTEQGVSLPYHSTSTNSLVWDLWTTNGGADTYVKLVGAFN